MNGHVEALKLVADVIKSLQLYTVYVSVGLLAFVSKVIEDAPLSYLLVGAFGVLFLGFLSCGVVLFYIAEEISHSDANLNDTRIRVACIISIFFIILSVVMIGQYVNADLL